MFCKRCGYLVNDNDSVCPQCGLEVNKPEPTVIRPPLADAGQVFKDYTPTQSDNSFDIKKLSVWCWLSIISLICACVTFYKGVDRMIHYNSGSHYPYESVNAYVGGDAYNYIINGTHATAFFVLTAMFVLAAIGLVIVHYVSQKK